MDDVNRLGKTPIIHLHKKNKHHQRTSSYHSDWDNSDADSTVYRPAKRDFKSIGRRVKKFVTKRVKFGSPGHSKSALRSSSMINLAAVNMEPNSEPSGEETDTDVNSSVYDTNSLEDSAALRSRVSRSERQYSFDQCDDNSHQSSITSKTTSAGSSHVVQGSVRDTRSRMRRKVSPSPGRQEQISEQTNDGSQIQSDSMAPGSQQGKPLILKHTPVTRSTSVTSSNQNSMSYKTENTTFQTRVGSRPFSVIPREGFFWQILLYIRLARALPVLGVSGKIDAYVKVKHRGETLLRTSTIRNNRNPVWDERFQFPINNLNFPLELRVYHRDAFKKNKYIGRVMVYPATLTFGLDKEFSVPLYDETERSVMKPLGELNFWITLGEIEDIRVPGDRRRSMIKQLKEDRGLENRLTPLLIRTPSDISQVSAQSRFRSQQFDSIDRSSWDMSREPSSTDLHLIASMDEYEPDYDEWLLPNAASFHQPQWPLLFYDGTNVEIYTANMNDKTQCISISNLVSSRTGKNEVPLENVYNRARLVVNLIRAENLNLPASSSSTSSAGNLVSPQSSSPKSKLLTGPGLERAVMGLPVAHTDGSIPSYVASLSIGKSSRKSRPVRSPSSPCWHQHFEFRLKLGEKGVLNVEIIDQALAVPSILFRGHLDFERQIPDWTGCFTLKNTMEGYGGHVILLVTLTGLTYRSDCASDESAGSHSDTNEEIRPAMNSNFDSPPLTPKFAPPSKELLTMVESHYSLKRTLENRRDVGWLHLVVRCARELPSVGRNGQSDPYCNIRLVNRCVHTATLYKTSNPSWNQAFVLPISDIYDVLEIVVLHNGKHGSEFLGRVSFPVIQIASRRCKWYTLKDKKLRKAARGAIFLESYIVYNPIRAAMRVVYPREKPWVWIKTRVHLRDLIRKYVPELQQKIDRIYPYAVFLTDGQKTFMHLYKWENPLHSSIFLAGIWIVFLFVKPYMVVTGMIIGFASCWVLSMDWFKSRLRHRVSVNSNTESDVDDIEEYVITEDLLEEDDDSEDSDLMFDQLVPKHKHSHKKPLKVKLAKAREVLGTLQSAMESVASTIERIDCLIKWQVPWLSLLFFIYLIFNALMVYFVPMRCILALYVTKYFTNRLPYSKYYNFSPMAIISRVPNKLQRINYREIHPRISRSNS